MYLYPDGRTDQRTVKGKLICPDSSSRGHEKKTRTTRTTPESKPRCSRREICSCFLIRHPSCELSCHWIKSITFSIIIAVMLTSSDNMRKYFPWKSISILPKLSTSRKNPGIKGLETLKLFRQLKCYDDVLHVGIQLHTTHNHTTTF